jgi:hypothetical protein
MNQITKMLWLLYQVIMLDYCLIISITMGKLRKIGTLEIS